MQANFNGLNKGITSSHNKQNGFTQQNTLIDLNNGKEIIKVRTYTKGASVYVCVWGYHNAKGFAGSAVSSGGGFNRPTEAAITAFSNAGFDITGETDQADDINGMLYAVAKLLGYGNTLAHVVKG